MTPNNAIAVLFASKRNRCQFYLLLNLHKYFTQRGNNSEF